MYIHSYINYYILARSKSTGLHFQVLYYYQEHSSTTLMDIVAIAMTPCIEQVAIMHLVVRFCLHIWKLSLV